MNIAIYLRKSRTDEEMEKALGRGETLSIHRMELLKYANAKKLNIKKIYEELVSGESLLHRPAMLELLKNVESGLYNAVLVMDLQRLGRGDMEEQGIILKAFKRSNTKIITPDKTYDLNNEFDEEYSEFEAFMSRKEYKMINKRLQRGILHSVREGNYNSPRPPFGYVIKEEKLGRTLEPDPERAEIVKMIFNWYANEPVGGQTIADRLNSLGIRTASGKLWSSNAVAYIVRNPVYIGKITWRKAHGYHSKNKRKANKKRPQDEWIVTDGKHVPIIQEELYYKAQEMMSKFIKSPVKPKTGLNNSLAGLVVCSICGAKMSFRPYADAEPYLICRNKCGNKSSKYKYVEKRILESLKFLISEDKYELGEKQQEANGIIEGLQKNLSELEKELNDLYLQKNKIHDLLEQEVYTLEVFMERSGELTRRIGSAREAIDNTKAALEKEMQSVNTPSSFIPRTQNVTDSYFTVEKPDDRNLLLKGVLSKVEYFKKKDQREDAFEIAVFPRL